MNTERAQVGWGFWLWWVLASTVGFAVGSAVTRFVGLVGYFAGGETVVGAFAVGGAVGGALIGIAQWLVLRKRVSRSGWWVLASIVGFAVGFAVAIAMLDSMDGAAVGAVVGASIGIAQWLVLRLQFSRAGWWVLASIVGFAMGFAVLETMDGFVVGAGVGAVVGAGVGAITGGVMVWMLRQPAAKELGPSQAAE
jgi:hypothetical protein